MDGRSDYAETPAATRLAMHIGSGRRWKADQKPVRAGQGYQGSVGQRGFGGV